MVWTALSARRRDASDEVSALTRAVLGLTVGVGGMAGVMALVAGQPEGWLAIPSALMLVALRLGRTEVAALAGTAIWAAVLPRAHAEGMLGPLLMIGACLAIALGPARLMAWVHEDFGGRDRHEDATGWIEEA